VNGIAVVETKRGKRFKIRYRVPLEPGGTATKQVTETLRHCPDLKSAQFVLSKRNAEIFDGEYRPRNRQKPVTVAEMAEQLLETRKTELRGWRTYAGSLRNHVMRLMGRRYLFEVNTGMCEDYRRKREAEGAALATIRNELRCLQGVFAEARKRDIVHHDPVRDIRFKGIKNTRERVPTSAEILRMVEAAQKRDDFLRPVFFLLFCTGMRISSALSIRWDGIHRDRGRLEITQKGGGKVRPPMADLLASELERWRPRSLEKGKGSGWVFPSRMRKHLTQTAVHKEWPEFLAAAKVEGVTRHDLRRWMVTRLRALGLDDAAIGAITGHATKAMIDRYDRGAMERALAVIPQAVDLKLISEDAAEAHQNAAEETKNRGLLPSKVP
jgi:integrase